MAKFDFYETEKKVHPPKVPTKESLDELARFIKKIKERQQEKK